MNLPSREECFELLKKEGTPKNIITHSVIVTKIAVLLATKLIEKGIKINVELVEKASLLHDIKKWDEIKKNKKATHGVDGESFLTGKYPELANLVKKHMLYEVLVGLNSWEEKIVNYADKRVNHDKIVSLKERFSYLEKRYNLKGDKDWQKVKELFYYLENEIFDRIDIEAYELETLIK
ncbi:HDIG domain-containing protein [Candidatus Woesearchaeota archaeon]|nr:HDIG domain-containing protein [Candidatus Woesearchaeota archaeon]